MGRRILAAAGSEASLNETIRSGRSREVGVRDELGSRNTYIICHQRTRLQRDNQAQRAAINDCSFSSSSLRTDLSRALPELELTRVSPSLEAGPVSQAHLRTAGGSDPSSGRAAWAPSAKLFIAQSLATSVDSDNHVLMEEMPHILFQTANRAFAGKLDVAYRCEQDLKLGARHSHVFFSVM